MKFALIKWLCVVFTAAILLVMFTPLPNYLARSLVTEGGKPGKSDVVVVLGGGSYGNSLGAASTERLLRGLILYREGYARKIIFSGGSISNPMEKIQHTFLEKKEVKADSMDAELMHRTAIRLGVPERDTIVEKLSTNTFENLERSAELMKKEKLKSCLIVTSPLHMKRATLVAKKLGIDCEPAPVEDPTGWRTGATDRLSLMREVLWEYIALTLYRHYGYI